MEYHKKDNIKFQNLSIQKLRDGILQINWDFKIVILLEKPSITPGPGSYDDSNGKICKKGKQHISNFSSSKYTSMKF